MTKARFSGAGLRELDLTVNLALHGLRESMVADSALAVKHHLRHQEALKARRWYKFWESMFISLEYDDGMYSFTRNFKNQHLRRLEHLSWMIQVLKPTELLLSDDDLLILQRYRGIPQCRDE